MTILALDQASRTSGYAVFCDDQLIDSGKFTFEDADIAKRLMKIRNKVEELINEFCIEKIILEDIQCQGNVVNNLETFKILAEVIGVLTELAVEKNLPYELVYSTVWKSTLQIKGRTRPEQKKNAQQYVLNTYGKKVTQDESDAICIGAHYTKKNMSAFSWD